MTAVAVLLLGTLGVGLRYLSDLYLQIESWPLPTFLVNVLGCFLTGWVFTSQSVFRSPLLIGLCGGLTTFSTLIVQTLHFIRNGEYDKAVGYFVLTQVAGLFAGWLGMKLNGT